MKTRSLTTDEQRRITRTARHIAYMRLMAPQFRSKVVPTKAYRRARDKNQLRKETV